MRPFTTFFCESFSYDTVTYILSCVYRFDTDIRFVETIDFSDCITDPLRTIPDSLAFALSLALGVSYYKAYPTPEIIVESGYLDPDQCDFWSRFYREGLGEFLYRNGLSPEGLFRVRSVSPIHHIAGDETLDERAYIPIGGGKDSLVSVELWRKTGIPYDLFTFGRASSIHEDTARIALGRHRRVTRTMDPRLFAMNQEGYYNGHIPITGIIAFVLACTACLSRTRYLVLSNERSANEGNVLWHGMDVNHQYSKSFAFEQDFGVYMARYGHTGIVYFSLLRGMYELRIAQEFSRFPQYFDVFSSCNRNFHIHGDRPIDRWCGVCPKCAFVWAILYPFIDRESMERIFGKNYYEDTGLLPLYEALTGLSETKPFECVGTADEVRLALALGYEKETREKEEGKSSDYSDIIRWFGERFPEYLIPTIHEQAQERLLGISLRDTAIPDMIVRRIGW